MERSALPVGRTLAELDMPRSSFYRWYQQYQQEGVQGLEPQPAKRRQFRNRLPVAVCDQIVQMARARCASRRFFDDQVGPFSIGRLKNISLTRHGHQAMPSMVAALRKCPTW